MKKQFILYILLLFAAVSLAQPPKKKTPPPTGADVKKIMQDAQKLLDSVDPETKRTLDSMGIQMPSDIKMPALTDKQLAEAYATEGAAASSKKTKLIAGIPTSLMSTSQLLDYLKKTNSTLAGSIAPASKQLAEKIMDELKSDPYYGAMIASAANGLWTMGYQQAAVYLMGKAAEALPNAHNYNNYAAYLTLQGAAHKAIPILQKLNAVHKNNSTVLNNLGQAWMQLGDFPQAEKYFDSTVRIYASHPQANRSKAIIKESEGKKKEAADALEKALEHSVTKDKLDQLEELEPGSSKPYGYLIPQVYFSTTFNLSMYSSLMPANYAGGAGMNEEYAWEEFRARMDAEILRVDEQLEKAKQETQTENQHLSKNIINSRGVLLPPYYQKALSRFQEYGKEMEEQRPKEMETVKVYNDAWQELTDTFKKEMAAEEKRYKEMKNDHNVSNCKEVLAIVNKYISLLNRLNQRYNSERLEYLTRQAYEAYNQFTSVALTDGAALQAALAIKRQYLIDIRAFKHDFYPLDLQCYTLPANPKGYNGKLSDYDDLHCNILNTIYSPGLGMITMRCNNMNMDLDPIILPFCANVTANFDGYIEDASAGISVKGVKMEGGARFDTDGNISSINGKVGTTIKGVKIDASGRVDRNGFVKGSVEMGIAQELKGLPQGLEGEAPVEIGLKNELGVAVEFGKEGITDMYIKDKVTGTVASNIKVDNKVEIAPGEISSTGKATPPQTVELPLPKAPSISVSADNRWGVNAGYVSGGSLSGIR